LTLSTQQQPAFSDTVVVALYRQSEVQINDMVVYEWFERFGQVLAPDKNYVPVAAEKDSTSIWHILAPDPNFRPPLGSEHFESAASPTQVLSAGVPHQIWQPPLGSSDPVQRHVSTPDIGATTASICSQCQSKLCPDCLQKYSEAVGSNRLESVLNSPGLYSPSPFRKDARVSFSLQTPRGAPMSDTDHPLNDRVLSAAKKQAEILGSPTSSMETQAFRFCFRDKPLLASDLQKVKKMIQTNPSLLTSRSSRMGQMDGLTMFMAAAYANQVGVLEVIWDHVVSNADLPKGVSTADLLRDTDLQGRSAYHIAAQRGSQDAVHFIKAKYCSTFGVNAEVPCDLLGRTPLGVAVLEPRNKERTAIIKELFTDTDKSVLGSPLPMQQRVVSSDGNDATDLHAQAGMSEMPGRRVLMEDFIVCRRSPAALLLSVCDGHDDRGLVSHFVAEGVVFGIDQRVSSMTEQEEASTDFWQDTCAAVCLEVENDLRCKKLSGGSVGVFTAITKKKIVVANVGDCRCILVQFKSDEVANDFISGSPKVLRASESDPVEACHDIITTIELSIDHKPSLPGEKQRIEESGLVVAQEVMKEENGQDSIIHKIKLSEDSMLACSRAFGDFEYKANSHLGPESQAVIASADVTVRERCSIDAFIILACDGVWDVLNSEEVAAFVTMRIHHHLSSSKRDDSHAILPTVGDELLRHCMSIGSTDNLSVVVAALSTIADRIADLSGPTAKALSFDLQT
jgi:serine/threonine protein phosphatase PrpC